MTMGSTRCALALALALASLACGQAALDPTPGTPDQPARPVISAFQASPGVIAPGGSCTLSWTVAGASALAIDQGVGVVGSGPVAVSPAASTTYRLSASNAAGTVTATATVTVTAPGAADVTVVVDTGQGRRAISPFVYGYNATSAAEAPPGATWLRLGGNRWTAYDWETNYSNAGSDWGPYSNDTFLGAPSDGPAHAALPALDDAKAHGLGLCVTIPIQGWVSKDQSGNVPPGSALDLHFLPSRARKGSAFSAIPDTGDGSVSQDEFAWVLARRWAGAAQPLHLLLDNEPDLWASTHAEIQRSPLGYADLLARSVAFAGALKDAAPGALVFGPASYGWNGFLSLQDAPDAAAHGDFLDHYLAQMEAAGAIQGRRLLDVLDLHFYSEAQGCAVRVAGGGNGDCVVAARVQAPRSLWDGGYVEDSWITRWTTGGQGIRLVPRMLAKIAASAPGTRLSLSEYNHGGEDHVSGALAQADTLGILGREGVYAAAFWPLSSSMAWAAGAWLAFRDYDGAGSSFGDTSVPASSSDLAHLSAFASVDQAGPGRVVLVLVHRPTLDGAGTLDLRARTVRLQVSHAQALGHARLWRLSGSSPVQGGVARPQRQADATVVGGVLALTLPALSVTTVELTP
jgi:hypothetical protein